MTCDQLPSGWFSVLWLVDGLGQNLWRDSEYGARALDSNQHSHHSQLSPTSGSSSHPPKFLKAEDNLTFWQAHCLEGASGQLVFVTLGP